ncbi:MAG: hypothetical protein QG635_1550, partial [Bacteroidota bacterium]|nr:hypothetical protein [Bacteroidota bacterium]
MNNIISIVTPSLNHGSFIEETIKSVLSQSGNFFIDYIIVDGSSEDNTIEILKKYENLLNTNCRTEKIDGIEYYIPGDKDFEFNKCLGISYIWLSEKDSGHADALNKGFKYSIGDVMAWLNSDDIYHPGAFDKVMKVFGALEEVRWLTGINTWWDEKGNLTKSTVNLKNAFDYINGNIDLMIQQESTFWRRDLWNQHGGILDERFKFMVDMELWQRFFRSDRLYHIDKRLGGFRLHKSNRSLRFQSETKTEIGIISDILKDDFKNIPNDLFAKNEYYIISSYNDCYVIKKEIIENKEIETKRHFEKSKSSIEPSDCKLDVYRAYRGFYGRHRSGWAYSMECLMDLNNPNGILVDGFVDLSFVWGDSEGSKCHLEPWVGFIHVPQNVPEWYINEQSNDVIFNSENWKKSLPYCKGLFTLSDYHKESLKKKLPVKIESLFHPTEIPEVQWSPERFLDNPD